MKKTLLPVILCIGLLNPCLAQLNVGGLKNKLEDKARQKLRDTKTDDAKDNTSKKEESSSTNETTANETTASIVPDKTNKNMNATLSGNLLFSGQPFLGDVPNNITAKDFKAWDELYGRVIFDQPLKQLLTGSFADAIHTYAEYAGTAFVEFGLKQDDNGSETKVQKRLAPADLERNYIDFDIAPSTNNSRDAWIVNFADGIASYGSSYFTNREKGKFTLSVFFLNGAHERIEGQHISGPLTIDYSVLPDGDEGTTRISAWNSKINQAADASLVQENKKKLERKASGAGPEMTFSNAKKETKAVFKAGEEIYGRIHLAKPLREYMSGPKVEKVQIDISCLNENINFFSYTKAIRASELDNNYIDFDVYPALAAAKDVYDNEFSFYYTFFGNGVNPGKPVKFEVTLSTQYNMNYNGFKKMEATGEIAIDYTGSAPAKIAELYTQGQKAAEEAKKNASILKTKENVELAKTLPLPIVFTKSSQAGYSGYSRQTILSMIKEKFRVTEVYMLTFDVADGSGDFTPLVDLNNYPTEKIGNHVFYFVFKDNDGHYKFSGGRLRMLYEGYGKYGEAYIFPYSPIMSGDPEFPHDHVRKEMGFDGIFFIDGAKIKK
jgi:hypothetical protein